MDELRYIVSLGFSGADVWRAIVIAFFVAMLIGRRSTPWQLGFVALFFDRLVWPLAGQAIAGANIQTIYASIAAMGDNFLNDAGLYVVRYLGLTIMIALFMTMRKRIHDMGPGKKARAAA